jgi:hypothetical protein
MKHCLQPNTSRQVKTVIVLKNIKDTVATAKYMHFDMKLTHLNWVITNMYNTLPEYPC